MTVRRTTLAACLTACLTLAAGPALAGDAKLDAAIKTFTDTGNDTKLLGAYCELTALLAGAESDSDTTKSDEVDAKVKTLLGTLGDGFARAIDLDGQLAPDSADAKAYRAAIDGLDAKCPK